MSIEIEQMTADEFAATRVALGERVSRFGAIWWLRTRGIFYSPLLPCEAFSPSPADAPSSGMAGFQHAVPHQRDANSVMRFLILDDLPDYTLARLDHNRRRLIKNAAKHFSVQRIQDVAAFKEQGFAAYSCFYHRTGYAYKSERRSRADFARWAGAVLKCSKSLVLGGYDQAGGLRSVSISYWIGPTLTYATFFCDTPALQKGVGEVMFHVLRETAGRTPGIREVFVRKYQGGNGMDQYYLLRGAKLVVKPARLHLHPAVRWTLKSWFPGKYAVLSGGSSAGQPARRERADLPAA